MLSERNQYLALEAENEKLKLIVRYLDSKLKKYSEFMETLKINIESKEMMDDTYLSYEKSDRLGRNWITQERISMPDFVIGHKGRQSKLLREIDEILSL